MEPMARSVAVHTLGRFAVVRDGLSLSVATRLPHKPIELLQALVALGGREVGSSLLCDAVWPDQGSVDPRNLLDNTLHRLRLLLGYRDVVTLGDTKLSLNPQRCWVDAWAFEQRAAERIADAPGADAAAALRIYQGHFLERESPRPWLLAYRMRLHTRFMRLMLHEGTRLEAAAHWARAADWYARGLEVDPLADDLNRRLARCRQLSGAIGAGVQVPLVSGLESELH